jgi:CDP-diacylglycerol--glycerol-3-phosphate 3-phosphatidyltransferase
VVRVLSKTGLAPNTLTLLGFLWSLAAAVVIAKEYLFIGGLLVLFSGAFDLFDGALARTKGQSTKFGAFLDSTLDRLSEAALLFGLLVLYVAQSSTLEIWLIFITLIGSASVSYARARAEGLGMKCEVGIFTRPERIIVLALGLLAGAHGIVIALWMMAILTLVTLVQRIIYVWQQTKKEVENYE